LEYKLLGKTGIKVSRLCFGALVIGPLQRNLSLEEGAAVIEEALRLGVNFIDTADLYDTYSYIRRAIERTGIRPVISSKCYAYTREDAKSCLDRALSETGIDYIDLFLMHEQESEHTIRGHWEAFEYYLEQKQAGIIKSVGISTHHIAVVKAATAIPEVDVIHPIVNKRGLGICDGTVDEMLEAIKKAHEAGKGIYGMKVFGGGNLLGDFEDALRFALGIPWLDSIAVGMQSIEEVRMNVALFDDIEAIGQYRSRLTERPKKALHADFWCEGCGKCARRCQQKALSLVEGKLRIDHEKCVLCGYCSASCPVFALKVY
jgi:aryl-alcohol dehydrogenase-like predicted oxidoreductase/Pyruvate/2-oxoacid:ferredoxin oxidoreductase delta subunit